MCWFAALREGLHEVVAPEEMRDLTADDLQMLLSGSGDFIRLADFKRVIIPTLRPGSHSILHCRLMVCVPLCANRSLSSRTLGLVRSSPPRPAGSRCSSRSFGVPLVRAPAPVPASAPRCTFQAGFSPTSAPRHAHVVCDGGVVLGLMSDVELLKLANFATDSQTHLTRLTVKLADPDSQNLTPIR